MLTIDLTGKRAFVAGVADDGGFGFAIAKSLAEAGASVSVGTWPPALNIFMNLLERGKIDESRKLSERAACWSSRRSTRSTPRYDTLADAPRTSGRTSDTRRLATSPSMALSRRIEADFGAKRSTSSSTRSRTVPR